MTEEHAGTYICTAENGVDKPVKNKIKVIVEKSEDNFVKRGLLTTVGIRFITLTSLFADIKQGKLQQSSSTKRKSLTLASMIMVYVCLLLI